MQSALDFCIANKISAKPWEFVNYAPGEFGIWYVCERGRQEGWRQGDGGEGEGGQWILGWREVIVVRGIEYWNTGSGEALKVKVRALGIILSNMKSASGNNFFFFNKSNYFGR